MASDDNIDALDHAKIDYAKQLKEVVIWHKSSDSVLATVSET